MSAEQELPAVTIESDVQQQMRLLVNHLYAYSDIIRVDALVLKYADLAEYFRIIVSESLDVKRLLEQLRIAVESDDFLSTVIREEIARHMYVIQQMLTQLPQKISKREFEDFKNTIELIASAVSAIMMHFENVLHITSAHLENIPLADLQQADDNSLSEYITQVETALPKSAGNVLLAGSFEMVSDIIQALFIENGFHVISLPPDGDLYAALAAYDICLICYDSSADIIEGEHVLSELKQHPLYHDIPVLICGSVYSDSTAIRFIQRGAVEFYAPGRSRRVLAARIAAAVSLNRGNYRKQLYIRALEMNKHSTSREFAMASAYVKGLLPEPFAGSALVADWVFLPSIELGGDIFGYSWLSPSEFSVFLLDVSGHGLEASLYSVTVMTLLKKQMLREASFFDPASVLTELNGLFRMEEQNNMFFTIFYGVYNTESRLLTYASAGGPPAVLYPPESNPEKLSAGGIVIGVDDDSAYENVIRFIPPGSKLFLFSDGIYEIRREGGSMMSLSDFIDVLGTHCRSQSETCMQFARKVEQMSATQQFDDDVSMIELQWL